ncbi:MAG: hypothetical protein JHC98_04955 [Thermoleophilaceae bacterium]|nr:hypothetical protein [Thermoleophilaceae bacterium]
MNLDALRPRIPFFGTLIALAVVAALSIGAAASSGESNPYYDPCAGNPYYYDSTDCYYGYGGVGQSGSKRPFAALNLGKKCHKAKFKVRPIFRDGVVLWSTLWAAKKKVKRLSAGPYVFTVNAKKLKKGKKFNVKLFVIFSTGDKFYLKTTFKTCK